jgi:hypothetical protein
LAVSEKMAVMISRLVGMCSPIRPMAGFNLLSWNQIVSR